MNPFHANPRLPLALFVTILSLCACGGGGSGGSTGTSSSGSSSGSSGSSSSSGGSTSSSGSSTSSSGGSTSSSGGGTTISVAPEDACNLADFGAAMLAAVNTARATGRNCGSTFYPAVPALVWNDKLAQAAAAHSHDMANNDYFSHTGLNGSTPGDRIAATGYSAGAWGENIYGGPTSVAAAVAGWLVSAGHCANIMRSTFTELGAACATNASAEYRNYWTQDFASPR